MTRPPGRVGVVRRSSIGELMHQPLELVARVIELAVDQGEAGARSRSRSVDALIRRMRCCFKHSGERDLRECADPRAASAGFARG